MAKPDWITLSKSSGSGNDTVTVTAAKNTSTTARSGSITVKSGSLSKVVTISQEGQTQQKGKIYLKFPSGAAFPASYVEQELIISKSAAIEGTVSNFVSGGTIESISDGILVIDVNGIDINDFVEQLNTGDVSQAKKIFFGTGSETDWIGLLTTTDQDSEDNYVSQYIAKVWQYAFVDGSDQEITCSILRTISFNNVNLGTISISDENWTDYMNEVNSLIITPIVHIYDPSTSNAEAAATIRSNHSIILQRTTTTSGQLVMNADLMIDFEGQLSDISIEIMDADTENLFESCLISTNPQEIKLVSSLYDGTYTYYATNTDDNSLYVWNDNNMINVLPISVGLNAISIDANPTISSEIQQIY